MAHPRESGSQSGRRGARGHEDDPGHHAAALKSLAVLGSLTFADTDLALSANYIQVKDALQIGTEARPYTHRATITLTGDDSNEGALGLSSTALSVSPGATLELHGAPRVVRTRLSATAPKGGTQLPLERGVDWRAGDNIVVASTDVDPTQAEPLVVQTVSASLVTVGILRPHHCFSGRHRPRRSGGDVVRSLHRIQEPKSRRVDARRGSAAEARMDSSR